MEQLICRLGLRNKIQVSGPPNWVMDVNDVVNKIKLIETPTIESALSDVEVPQESKTEEVKAKVESTEKRVQSVAQAENGYQKPDAFGYTYLNPNAHLQTNTPRKSY